MTRPITILLIDSSPITSVRLVELLQKTEDVHNVIYAKDVRKGCAMFSVCALDVLILATQLVKEELIKLCQLCNSFQCEIILLTEYTTAGYKSWCKRVGVSHLLDKASEIGQVEIILKKMAML